MFQCVAACCSVLQRVEMACNGLQCVAVCCRGLQRNVLQHVAASCSMLPCVAVCRPCVAVQCSVFSCVAFLQCVPVSCCSALPCVAVRCTWRSEEGRSQNAHGLGHAHECHGRDVSNVTCHVPIHIGFREKKNEKSAL